MFNATVPSSALFANTQGSNLFGQTQTQQTGFFGSTNINGTTVKYVPLNGSDTIQRNNQAVTVQTKLNCISAMKEYEAKSLEELRCEDYSANRIAPQKNVSTGIFGGSQTTPALFNNQTSMFQPNSPFGTTQQTTLGTGTQNNLFGASNQTNAFGSKNLFGGTTTSTNSAFGSFNSQSKPTTLFGMNTSTANKPLFGATQPTQSTSLFAGTQQNAAPLFGSQTQTQPAPLFGGLSQQSQSTGLFNSNTTTPAFGFQAPSTGLFGSNNTSKTFVGGTNTGTSFSFSNSTTPTNTSLFGAAAPTSGLFSQNTTNTAFGTSKPSLFSTQGTFNTAASSATQNLFPQQTGAFGQTNNLFGNQQKQTAFGGTGVLNNSPKPNLFGTNTSTGTGFGPASTNLFGNMGTSTLPFNSTITTSTIAPVNNSYQIGITTPADAVYQQQLAQQKVLSLVSNRPYGVNKLFMGQNRNSDLKTPTTTAVTESSTNNTNLLSLVIKRNDMDQIGTNQRRRILNVKTKVIPNQLYKVFSGFDEDEDQSTKSNTLDNFFFTKREDWKYLPPAAFEKSRKSINAHNSLTNENLLPRDKHLTNGISSPSAKELYPSLSSSFSKETSKNYCSTPLSENALRKVEAIQTSPIHNARSSPINYAAPSQKDSFIRNSSIEELSIKSHEPKEELLSAPNEASYTKLPSVVETNSRNDIFGDTIEAHNEETDNIDIGKRCLVKLSKPGYYTAPKSDILDQLVTTNDNGDKECWVESFIIGRNDYGSIRFPGLTNVYGLCLDDLVDIQRKEVSVYPNDDEKPEEGEGLNKLAQVILTKVWPTDKSTGELIRNASRLKVMNFEEKLRRSTERLGARFVSYTPENGIWIFEVDHFSKYTFLDSDDEEPVQQEQKPINQNKDRLKSPTKGRKPLESSKNSSNANVVLAEADSMSNALGNHGLFQSRSVFDKLLNPSGSRNILKMKQSFYNYDSDEEMHYDDTGFNAANQSSIKNHSFMFKKTEPKVDRDQPKPKKFETCEMGETIFTSQHNSKKEYSTSNLALTSGQLMESADDDKRPIEPLAAKPLAPTTQIKSSYQSTQHMSIPSHMRDLRSLKMPYLFLKIVNYFDTVTVDIHKKYPNNVALVQGDRFRVCLHQSGIAESPGLQFFKINSASDSVSPFRASLKKSMPNSIMVMRCDYGGAARQNIIDYQRRLMESCLSVSECWSGQETKCPMWGPPSRLHLLNCYLATHRELKTESFLERSVFERIIGLCNALWNNLGEDKQNGSPAAFLHDLGRKQLFSKWIKMEGRQKLTQQVESLAKSATSSIDIDKCNTVILKALCSGEINLACQLAIATKQHRMSLLIAQAATDLQGREVLKEQLNLWLQSRTDEHIPSNILCIYMILSGQTSLVLSDGSILAPFKEMSWVQALGSHFWYSQSYLGSIKSAVDLYDDAFKTELDMPSPYPIGSPGGSGFDNDDTDDDYPYYDCCYHLIKLYCDRLHDLDVLLNPPTMSRHNSHKLSWDWSASWHLANILTSLGFSSHISPKISSEWAAQLEREGLWQMAAFVAMHIPHEQSRVQQLRNIIDRHATPSKALTEAEQFLIDRLRVPAAWIHEAKAIHCKSVAKPDIEAYHWLKANQFEKSHQLYIDAIIPDLLVSDKFDRITEILHQFVHAGADKVLPNWAVGGELYLKYIHIVSSLRTLKLTNKLANHSFLMDVEFEIDNIYDERGDDFQIQMHRLKGDVLKLRRSVDGFRVTSDAQRVCKQQIVAMCSKFHDSWPTEIF